MKLKLICLPLPESSWWYMLVKSPATPFTVDQHNSNAYMFTTVSILIRDIPIYTIISYLLLTTKPQSKTQKPQSKILD